LKGITATAPDAADAADAEDIDEDARANANASSNEDLTAAPAR
jgi:hypothetical protein